MLKRGTDPCIANVEQLGGNNEIELKAMAFRRIGIPLVA
jgi:hypothetical protein